MAEWQDLRTLADAGTFDHAVGTHAHVVGQTHFTLEDATHVDLHIFSAIHLAANIDACRIGQRYAVRQQASRFHNLPGALQHGQLQLAVHAVYFPLVCRLNGMHLHTLLYSHADDIGKVVLTLCIVVLQFRQPPTQFLRRGKQDAGVHLGNLSLLVRGIFFLDNALHLALIVAQDAAVAGGVRHVHRE